MKKQKTKRSKSYRPKYVSKNPMSTFMGGMSGEHADHLQKLNIINHGALAAIVTGCGTRNDWDRLIGAINMGNVMCESGIGNEYRADMMAARDALCECGKRAVLCGRFIFTGDELRAVNAGMAAHDAQVENVRAIDLDRAADEVLRRIRYGVNTTNVRAELERAEVKSVARAALEVAQ